MKRAAVLLVLVALMLCASVSAALAQVDVTATGGTPSASYTTLKGAFDAINAGTHTGDITIGLSGNTTEGTTPATLNSAPAGSASYTSVLIRPTADGVSISGNPAQGFGVIQLNGVDNVTINGDNPNTSGTNRDLTINNTAASTVTYGSVVRIATSGTAPYSTNDNIAIRNCNLNGNVTGGNSSSITPTTTSSNASFGVIVGPNGGASVTAVTSVTGAMASGVTVNGLVVDNNAVNQCARGIVFLGANSSSSTGITIYSNVVGAAGTLAGDPPYTSPATTVYTKGIYVTGTNAVAIAGNTVRNILSYVATTMSAIELTTGIGSGTIMLNNNVVNGVVNNGTSSGARGIDASSASGTAFGINGNTVTNVQCMGSVSIMGVNVSTSVTGGLIEKNKVTQVYSRGTGTYGSYGISVAGGSNLTIQNNFVSDIHHNMSGGGAFSTSFGVFGLRIAGGTGHKVYHNSVNLYGPHLGTAASSLLSAAFAIGGTGQTGLDVRNNLFVNTIPSGTTSVAHVSIWLPSAGTSAMNLTLNNNAYFSGTDAARQGIGQVGTTAGTGFYLASNFDPGATTPATNMRAYTSTLSAAGTNDNASFGTTAGAPFTTPTDLHIVAGTMTLLESGGAAGTGVAVDIDNEARPGPPGSIYGGGTANDIGADEFDGTPVSSNDIAATAFVDPTNGGAKVVGVAFDPKASFTNLGTATQTDVPVRYRIVGPSPSTDEVYNETASIASISSMGTVTVTFPSATLADGGVYAIYASSELVGDQVPGNDQIVGSCRGIAPLSGTYLVGVSEFNRATGLDLTFERQVTTVTRESLEPVDETEKSGAAADRLVWKTVTHEVEQVSWTPVTGGRAYEGSLYAEQARGTRGVYATITAAVADLNAAGVAGPVEFLLTDATYPSETFPITVNVTMNVPDATNTVTFKPYTGVTATIAGPSAGGSLFRVFKTNYITIDGSNSDGGTTRDLTLENTSATSPMVVPFGSSGTTPITNVALKNCVVRNGVNTNTPVVISDGTTAGNAGYFSNIEVRNNRIEKAYIGVYCNAAVAALNGSGLTIVGNDLNTSGANAIRYVGLYLQGVDGGVVAGNDIGNFETATSETDRGIWLATSTVNTIVNANRIHDLRYTGTLGYGAKGIGISTGAAAAGVVVSNNMIFNITGDGDSYTTFGCTYTPVGIYAWGTGQGGVGIYANSIYLYGNTINYSAAAYSVGIGLDDGSAADVTGNCVVNNLGRLALTGAGSVALALEIGASQLTGGDYNDLFCNATGGGLNLVGKIAAANYADLPTWRTASGRDANSISADPQYVGTTDLHIRQDLISPVGDAGTTITGIAYDFDGDPRGANPDIGADEFTIYFLATSVVGNGSIQVVPSQAAYAPGTPVTLTAIPGGECYEFVGWSGDAGGNTNPLQIVMDANKDITATFALKTFTIAASAGEGGTIEPEGDVVVDCGGDATFTITPDVCYDILDVVVDGESVGAVESYLFEDVVANHTPHATFALKTFTLTTEVVGNGSLLIVPDLPTYECGAEVEITAIPDPNWEFDHWEGDATGTDNPVIVVMDGDKTVTGVFIEIPSPVEVAFYATIVEEQAVVLRWAISGHSAGSGLLIYRSLAAEGPFECITPAPLTDVTGGTFVDRNAWPGGTFWYELRVVLPTGEEIVAGGHPSVTVPGVLAFGIRSVAPNPTTAGASIAYSVPVGARTARLSVYDVAGRVVRHLTPEADSRGGYATVEWDGLDNMGARLVSGVYFVRLEVDGAVASQKLTLLR